MNKRKGLSIVMTVVVAAVVILILGLTLITIATGGIERIQGILFGTQEEFQLKNNCKTARDNYCEDNPNGFFEWYRAKVTKGDYKGQSCATIMDKGDYAIHDCKLEKDYSFSDFDGDTLKDSDINGKLNKDREPVKTSEKSTIQPPTE